MTRVFVGGKRLTTLFRCLQPHKEVAGFDATVIVLVIKQKSIGEIIVITTLKRRRTHKSRRDILLYIF